MQQQEIQFFWPLTEQIPLGLNYEGCEKPKVWTTGPVLNAGTGLTFASSDATWSVMTIDASKLNLDVEELEFKLKKKPSLLRRIAYKVMGLKWKVK